MTRQVLLVAFHYPPASAVGARRALRLARYLPAHGYEVAVVAADPLTETGAGVDPALLEGAPSVPVYLAPARDRVRALSQWRRGRRSGRARDPMPRGGASEGGASRLARGLRSRGTALVQGVKDVASDVLRTPDASAAWIGPARAAGRRAISARGPDVVIATAPPWSALVAGALIARDARVPLVLDLRDPWVGNPYSGPATRIGRWLARLSESRCLARASLVVATTPALAEHLGARYPGLASRTVTVPNGPDGDAPVRAPREARAGYGGVPGRGPLRIVHTGSLYGGRDPRPLIAAARGLLSTGSIGPRELVISLVGSCAIAARDLRADLAGLDGLVELGEPVSHPEALRLTREADALLLLQPGAPLQLPAKAFEYLEAGREVLTIAGPGATADFAREVGLGRVAPPDDLGAIASSLLDLVRRKRAGSLRSPSQAALDRYRPERLVGELARAMDRVL